MSDAAELIQAVTEMEERARQVPELAKGIANRAAGYHDQVKAYLDRIKDKSTRVTALQAVLDESLKALQDKGAAERPQLESGQAELDSAISQAREAVEEAAGELDQAVDATVKSAGELKSELAEAGQRADTAQETAGSDLDGLAGQMKSSESGLDTFVDSALNTTDGVEQAADEESQKVVAGLQALAERMMEYVEQHVGSRLDKAQDDLEGLFEAHGTHMSGVVQALEASCLELAGGIKERIEEEVTDRISALVEQAAESYLGLQQAHAQAQGSSSEDREETGRTAAELFEWLEPMREGVRQVQQAAQSVNTPWPG